MKIYFSLLLIGFSLFSETCTAQTKEELNLIEKNNLKKFEDFKIFLVKSMESQKDITDTANMKYMLLNFIVSEYSLDSSDSNHLKKGEIPEESLKSFKRDIKNFYSYFAEKRTSDVIYHLSALPIRLSSDKCIYEKFTPFQKENAMVYFDDRHPHQILGYLLFMPKGTTTLTAPRIWSWILLFESGYWSFKSPMGTVGVEHLVSEGIKGPKYPVGY